MKQHKGWLAILLTILFVSAVVSIIFWGMLFAVGMKYLNS